MVVAVAVVLVGSAVVVADVVEVEAPAEAPVSSLVSLVHASSASSEASEKERALAIMAAC